MASFASPSSRGRGLKCFDRIAIIWIVASPSSRGRGLKFHRLKVVLQRRLSPSSRGRGLKYNRPPIDIHAYLSPSSRGRGLKSDGTFVLGGIETVALFTRAWIEICQVIYLPASRSVALFTRAWIEMRPKRSPQFPCASRPLHEGVD